MDEHELQLDELRLVPGENGVFDVAVDGKTVFSKHKVGRFPEPGEVKIG